MTLDVPWCVASVRLAIKRSSNHDPRLRVEARVESVWVFGEDGDVVRDSRPAKEAVLFGLRGLSGSQGTLHLPFGNKDFVRPVDSS